MEFLQGDFTEDAVLERLIELLKDQQADLVISDMAPNMSGMRDIDLPRVMYLAELALDLVRTVLKPDGASSLRFSTVKVTKICKNSLKVALVV